MKAILRKSATPLTENAADTNNTPMTAVEATKLAEDSSTLAIKSKEVEGNSALPSADIVPESDVNAEIAAEEEASRKRIEALKANRAKQAAADAAAKATPARPAATPATPAPAPVKAAAIVTKTIEVQAEVVPPANLPSLTIENENGPVPAAPTTSALATRNFGGDVEGEYDESDVRLPRLQIVTGSGELSQQYTCGTLLFMNEVLFTAANPKEKGRQLRFVPVHMNKQFRESVDPKLSDAMPRIVNTLAEVRELGGTTEFIGGVKPSWGPTSRITLLLEKPENVEHTGFTMEIDGKFYAPAVYYAASTGYRSMALPIFNAASYLLRDAAGKIQLCKRFWTFRCGKKPSGNFTVDIPEVSVTTENTSEAIRSLCAQLMGATVAAE